MARITEIKQVKVFQDCLINPVCLSWRNKLGGWGIWVFHGSQKISIDVNESQVFERFIEDLSKTSTIKDYLYKRASYEILLGAENLEAEDMAGLEGLLMSHRVRMLVSGPGTLPLVWVTVLIPTGKFTVKETNLDRYSIEFPIRLPETLLQNN